MNEVRESYNETQKERSQVARSAFNKGNGSATSPLGKKPLTNKEIEEKHGPVKTYTLDDFLSFQEFREMPKDWQVSYINHLQDKYDIGLAQINRDLFGQRDNNVLRSHLKMRGIIGQVNPNKARGKTGLNQFRDDILAYRTKGAPKVEESEEKELCRFMTWDMFKTLDTDSMVSFINRIIEEYNIGIKNIDIELFGNPKSSNLLRKMLIRNNILDIFKTAKGGTARGKAYKANLDRFKRDIQKWKEEAGMCIKEQKQEKKSEVVEETTKDNIETTLKEDRDELVKNRDNLIYDPMTNMWFHGDSDAVRKMADKFIKAVEAEANERLNPQIFETKQKVFHTAYIADGIDMNEIETVKKMFTGKKIQVELTICTV